MQKLPLSDRILTVAIPILWIVLVLILIGWIAVGCTPTPTVPHDFRDAGAQPLPVLVPCDTTTESCQACTLLAHLGCPEGCGGGACVTRGRAGGTCATVLQSVLNTHLTNPNVPCVLRAHSGAEVRACGPYWVDACEGQ